MEIAPLSAQQFDTSTLASLAGFSSRGWYLCGTVRSRTPTKRLTEGLRCGLRFRCVRRTTPDEALRLWKRELRVDPNGRFVRALIDTGRALRGERTAQVADHGLLFDQFDL